MTASTPTPSGAVHGRPVPVPDPTSTAAALRDRVLPGPDQSRYGAATTDPLGRLTRHPEDGSPFKDRLPRHPCPRCDPTRPLVRDHKGGCR